LFARHFDERRQPAIRRIERAKQVFKTSLSYSFTFRAPCQLAHDADLYANGPFACAGLIPIRGRHQARYRTDDRLQAMIDDGGVMNCSNAQNCVESCPKGIPLTEAIAAVKRDGPWNGLSRWLKE
jgi:hypothetical protein